MTYCEGKAQLGISVAASLFGRKLVVGPQQVCDGVLQPVSFCFKGLDFSRCITKNIDHTSHFRLCLAAASLFGSVIVVRSNFAQART